MKIKTITCHDVYNVGASLQAYALVTYLRSLGHDAEIIDYKPDYLSNHYKLWGLNNPIYNKPIIRELYNLAKLPNRIKSRYSHRKKEFDSFRENYLPLTEYRYHSNNELKDNPPEAEVYFAGSDQIWNTLFENGKDPAFYLDFVIDGAVKASYAASFATKDISDEWKPQIKKWLSEMNYISVREKSGLEIIQKLGIDNAVQVFDPVFLIDSDKWVKIEKDMELSEPYLLIYDFDNSPIIAKFVKQMAKENGWKIYSVLKCDYCDKCFADEGPQAFVYLIHNAQFVVSNSFHATAFSLIFHKQFVVFNRYENINARMKDLLDTVELNKCMINELKYTFEIIDYIKVDKILNYKINKSRDYIDKVIMGAFIYNEEKNSVCN